MENFQENKEHFDFPHDQINDSKIFEQLKQNIDSYFKNGDPILILEADPESYSKCKFSNEKVRNFEANERIEKVG